jgi:hypothetical protein
MVDDGVGDIGRNQSYNVSWLGLVSARAPARLFFVIPFQSFTFFTCIYFLQN